MPSGRKLESNSSVTELAATVARLIGVDSSFALKLLLGNVP